MDSKTPLNTNSPGMASYSSIPQGAPYPPAGGNAPLPNVGFAPGYPQGQPQGYPQGQPQGYPQGQPQGYPQGQPQGYPQGQPQGYPQGQAQGYPQGQPQGYPQGQPQGYPQGEGPGYPQGEKGHVEPSAPVPELVNAPDYANVQFDGSALPPPTYEDAMREPPERGAIPSASFITSEDAKEALQNFVADNCCYGKGPIDEMTFRDLKSSSAFHYSLESFCESRSVKWKFEPYHGQTIISTGPPPGPWELPAQPPVLFKDNKLKVEVPNTAVVKPCHKCRGRGYERCSFCHGRGEKTCLSCNGRGEQRDAVNDGWRNCMSCHGSGTTKCTSCHGRGETKCMNCHGQCSLKWYIQLTIQWKNNIDHHVVERTALPSELITHVSGLKAFEESYPRVYPVNHFPEQEINNASSVLIAQHGSKFPSGRILMQRHNIRIVPVTEVMYNRKGKDSSFFVYGQEHKVYFPDYPAKCCCGCSII